MATTPAGQNSCTEASSAVAVCPREELPAAWEHLLGCTQLPAVDDAPVLLSPQAVSSLGLLLDVRCNRAPIGKLDVVPVRLWRTPDGDIETVDAIDASQPDRAGLSDAECALLDDLLALPRDVRGKRAYVHVEGDDAAVLVERMLAVASCFLGGTAGFWLQHGPARRPAWQWQVHADGRQSLLPRLASSRQIVHAGKFWYLDPEDSGMGLLHGPLLVLVGVGTLPALTPGQAVTLADRLPGSVLAEVIPSPATFPPPAIIDCVPACQLTLHALSRHVRQVAGMPPLAYACLAFDYDGVRLSGHGREATTLRLHEGALVEVTRHRADELAAIERLEQLGLVSAVDCEGLPWALTEVLPECAWLFPGAGHSGALEVNTPARWLGMRLRLEPEGFEVGYDPSFPFELVDENFQWYVQARAGRGKRDFALEMGVTVAGKRANLLPAISAAVADGQISLETPDDEPTDALWYAPLDDRRRIAIRLRDVRPLLGPIAEYLGRPRKQWRLPWGQAGRLEEIEAALPGRVELDAPSALHGLAGRLREAVGKAIPTTPEGFAGTLRTYQKRGLHWLNVLAEAGLGGVLADDMGLGKTVQTLAHILALREAGKLPHPVLLVAPTSLLPNWAMETTRYAPDLSLLTVHGPQRHADLERLDQHDVVLTSYALLPRDFKAYQKQSWSLLVLDEAQQVKNPRTQARRAARKLKATRRICLTGTPLENHLGELWSQIDLAVPGLLGNERVFREQYRLPIEKFDDETRREQLRRRIAPFILRRTKTEVMRELPPKSRIRRRVVMDEPQRRLYDRLETGLYEDLRETIAEQGIERSGIVVLDALLKLRQACCDPRLLKQTPVNKSVRSAKFDMLMDMLPELIAEGRRILLFSQFTEMLGLIAAELDRRGMAHVQLTGQTRDRAAPVAAFQDGKVPLFLLSLKAGGVGLNLTAADTVIHYDPWWNPAAETQASDRAHRIGQDKPVFVYRLVCTDSVEERIEALKARKAELADAVLAGSGADRLAFTEDDLDSLFGAA